MAQVDDNGRRSAGAVTVKAHKRKPKGAPPTAKPKVPVKPYTRAAPSVMGRTQAAAKVEERAPGQRKRIRQTYVQQPLAERQKQAAAAQKQKGGVADVIRTTHDERERAHAVTQAFVKWAKAKPEDRGKPTADIVKGARVVKNRTEKIDLKNAMKAFGQAPGKLDKVQGPKNTGLLATVDAVLAGVKTAGAVKKAGDFVGEHFMKGSAFARVSDVSGSKVVKNAGRELVDIPANAVPSLYVPAKELATGHPGKAAKTLAQPFVELAKHPLKSLEDHPVSSALMLSGVEGAIGRGAGAALRRAPSEALREVGSTKGRAPATVPGTTLREDRPFSKNVIHKAFQVRAEKGRTEPPIMSTKQIQRRADEHAAASEDIRRINRDRTVKESTQAIGGKKANAETSLVAQRITNGSEADLRAYLDELKKAEPNLEGSRLAANQEAQRAIEGALKKRDPEVQAHGEAYAKINVALQTLLAKHGVLSETAMETARRLPAAARDGVRQKDGELFDALGDPLPAEALAPKGDRKSVV